MKNCVFIKNINKHFGQFAIALALTGLVSACGTSAKKVELSAGANPQTELQRLESEIAQGREQQFDLLAPDHYEEAVELRDDALEKIAENKPTAEILDDIAQGLGHTQAMLTLGQKNQRAVEPILAARTNAINAKANEYMQKDFRKIDDDLEDIGQAMQRDSYKLDAKEIASLESRYMDIELKATKAAELGEAKSLLEKAQKSGANRYTPRTFQFALSQFAAADSAIEASRRNPQAYNAQVDKAVAEAQKVNEVLAISRDKKINEAAALQLWNQDRTIASQQSALDNSQASIQQLQSNVASSQAERFRLEQTNQEMVSQQELQAKIEEFKNTFGEDEAQIVRDGNRYIVRLKNMQFPRNRAELPTRSMETLQKISELVALMPTQKVTIEGHTDSTGSAEINQKLSEERASTVKTYFVTQGMLDATKIETEGFGFEKPLATNKTKEGRAMNRRVDVVIETNIQ